MKTSIPSTVCFLLLLCSSNLLADDWPMLGRDVTRNPVSSEKNPPTHWDVESGKNIKWKAKLGSMTHGTPVVADGQVYIGTNNGAGYLKRYPDKVDLGVLLCFRESDGKFLWQYSAEKLPIGRIHDWPMQGIGASPLVEGNRMWFVSNRWEVICLDTQGFHDGENDGPLVDEPAETPREADVVWRFDMIKELGVFPHNQGMGPTRRCSPAASYKNRIYLVTGNGVDEGHVKIPTPDAPSLVCMDKRTGKVLWTDNSPGANVLHGQFASPLLAEIADRAQVIVPQGDGWVRSFDALSGELIWKFDVNRKEAKWILGGQGTRCHVLATPVLYRNRIYMASGQEVEHGEGIGRLFCLDPTKTGDISAELAVDRDRRVIPHRRLQAVDPKQGEQAIANPNTGVIWEFTSKDDDFYEEMHRTISTVSIRNGLLIATDFAGLVHCFDAETGKRHWYYDCLAAVWSTPLIVDDRIYVADEDGDMAIFALSAAPDVASKGDDDEREPLAEINMGSSINGSPIFANGTLYVAPRNTLFAIADENAVENQKGAAAQPPGGHWPRWRGPQGNNRSTESGLLQEWPKAGPPLVWRADGLGEGIASLSIGDGRIVTICQHDETEYVRALDESTGAHLWTAPLGKVTPQSRLMRWLTQRAPTIDGDRLYAVSLLGEVVCLRAKDGIELWRRNYADEFGGERPIFGYADCPLVDGKRVICTPGGTRSTVVALDRDSGKVIWTSAVADSGRASHSSAVIAKIAGKRQVVTFLGETLVGIAVDDGALLWRDDSAIDRYNPNPPIVRGDDLVLVNGSGPGMRLVRIARGDDGHHMKEIHSVRSSHFYRFHNSAFLIDDYLFEITRVATCIDCKTGEIVWQKRASSRPASATWADGRFYSHASDGMMKLFEASSAGYSEKGSFALADHQEMSGATAPVVAGGRLYVREDTRLFCYDVRRQSGPNTTVRRRVELPQLAPAAAGLPATGDPASDPRRIVNSAYSPTPRDVVTKMLALAGVEKDDVVFDLGSGDGRIVISAAKAHECEAVGYEADPELVKLSRRKARENGVADRVTFHQADLFTADLSKADVVALYLLPVQNKRLIPQLKRLRAGARIVSHQFEIPGAVPDKVIKVESDESGESHRLYLYSTPLKVK